ncbi:MAG: TraR/DksA C4-type zinc finger protein [Bacillota bacterium]|nr:TraR/DksA C4-type zinc finger protein [Bacillota bacterium]
MSELNYSHYARLLQEEKDSILNFMAEEGMGKHISFKDSIQELSLIDNHPADTGSELFERSKDLSLHEKRLMNLQDINSALERIADGSYGQCLSCGREIEKERLETIPSSTYCFSCKVNREKQIREEGSDRPVEELVLYPPFKRTFLDNKDFVGFDGEDAWQAVARYGTADSPQDVPGTVQNPAYVDSQEDRGAADRIDRLASTRNRKKTMGEEEADTKRRKNN